MIPVDRPFKLVILGFALALPFGCGPTSPDARIEAPIITEDAPRSSEEAAALSEPSEQEGQP